MRWYFPILAIMIILLALHALDAYIIIRSERAYFDGQLDALRGDVRIDTLNHKWNGSPWNSREPRWKPEKEDFYE